MTTGAYAIRKIELWPADIPLTNPFVVATGRRVTAENAFVRITLKSGVQGYGELAPFPEVGGESRTACLSVAAELAEVLMGHPAIEYRALSRRLDEVASHHPAVRSGLETALVDAIARELGIPLWALWGGADVRERDSDITIPITSTNEAVELCRGWYRRGFRLFKMKVGSSDQADVDADVRRVEAVHNACADIAFIADANQGFTRAQCSQFVKDAQRLGARLLLLEQPVVAADLESLAGLRRDFGVPIAVDESVRSLPDVRDVVRAQAADFVNIKIMKSGLCQAIDMAAYARAAGLRLMIGGMIESRVAMGCSFALALGMGGYEVLDLDTPLLMVTDPVTGGYRYHGASLQPWAGSGLDLQVHPAEAATVITIE